MSAHRVPMLDRIASKYEIDDQGCWIWTAAKDRHGYGRLGGKTAHRVTWQTVVGDIDPSLVLDHLCRNVACINPDHMEPVTQKVNIERGVGVGAWRATNPLCPQGHVVDRVGSDGRRYCGECKRINTRRWRADKGK